MSGTFWTPISIIQDCYCFTQPRPGAPLPFHSKCRASFLIPTGHPCVSVSQLSIRTDTISCFRVLWWLRSWLFVYKEGPTVTILDPHWQESSPIPSIWQTYKHIRPLLKSYFSWATYIYWKKECSSWPSSTWTRTLCRFVEGKVVTYVVSLYIVPPAHSKILLWTWGLFQIRGSAKDHVVIWFVTKLLVSSAVFFDFLGC